MPVCIDGPHALVSVPLDLDALDCDYYTASCHKWLLAPVGAGFCTFILRTSSVRSAIESWGVTWGQPPSWRDEFNWTGTRDPTSVLAIPAAIDFLERVGVEAFRQRTHYLGAASPRSRSPPGPAWRRFSPDDTAWYASMACAPAAAGRGAAAARRPLAAPPD